MNQRLALLLLELQEVDRRIAGSPRGCASWSSTCLEGLEELSDDVRYMAYRFHPSILDDLGLKAALQRLLDDFSSRTGVKSCLSISRSTISSDKAASTALYRVVESLSNIAGMPKRLE